MRTNRDVEKLQEFLKEKKKEVEVKKSATDKLLEEMGKQRSEVFASIITIIECIIYYSIMHSLIGRGTASAGRCGKEKSRRSCQWGAQVRRTGGRCVQIRISKYLHFSTLTLFQNLIGDLAIAKPAMDAANDAVNCLDKASLTELKSFAKPPAGVDKVTTALLIMIKVWIMVETI